MRKMTLRVVLILAVGFLLLVPTSASALIVGNVTVVEGAQGETKQAAFTITCGSDAGVLTWTTANETAVADADYTAATSSPPGTCAPLTPTTTVNVPIKGDGVDEPNETFKLNATVTPLGVGDPVVASGTGTIVDDDVPVATINQLVQVAEGDSGTSNATFTVTLSQASWQDVTIPYSTQSQSAAAGSDFIETSGNLTIPAGQLSRQIGIPIIGDTVYEQPELFYVNLGDTDTAKVALDNTKRQGLVGIYDNDPKPTPEFSLGDNVRLTEGNSGTINMIFTVTLSFAADQDTQVSWKTANWTADLADYQGGQGILKFAKGETSKTFSVNVKGDLKKETTEMFAVFIEGPVGGSIKKNSALGIIDDDDGDGVVPPGGSGPKVAISKPTRDGKRLATLIKCPATAAGCNGLLTAAAGKIRVGRARFELQANGETDLVFKMSLKARRALRKRALRVKFTAVTRDLSGAEGTATKTFSIKKTRR